MTSSSPKTPGRVKRIVIAVLLASVLCGAGAAIWWYRPANAEHRYNNMSLVSLKQLLDGDPNNAKAWRQFALRLAHEGDASLAEPALTRALELNPNDPLVVSGLGELWMSKGRYPEAFQLLKMTIAAHPKDASLHRALGKLYLDKGSFQHAYDEFEIVAEADSTADDARYKQAVCSMELNQPAKAQEAINKALTVQPNNPAYIALAGTASAAAGNAAEGIADLERAAKLAPKNTAILAALVNLLLSQHRNAADLTSAEESIALLEQLSPDYPPLPLQRAKLEMLKQNWQSAARYFELAMKTPQNLDDVYLGLSQAYQKLGRVTEANKALAEYNHRQEIRKKIQTAGMALNANPRDVDAYGSIAALEMQLGNRGSALRAIRAGLQIDPSNARLQQMQSTLEQMTAPPK